MADETDSKTIEDFYIDWDEIIAGPSIEKDITKLIEEQVMAYTARINSAVGIVVRRVLDKMNVDVCLDSETPAIVLSDEWYNYDKDQLSSYEREIPLIPLLIEAASNDSDFMPNLRAMIRRVDEERLLAAEAKTTE